MMNATLFYKLMSSAAPRIILVLILFVSIPYDCILGSQHFPVDNNFKLSSEKRELLLVWLLQ